MTALFMACAVGGGVVLLCQLALMLLGVDHHSDLDPGADIIDDPHMGDDYVDVDHGSSWFFGVLSFRALTAALTFFGLGGLAANGYGFGAYTALVFGVIWGGAAMLLVAWLMRLLMGLRSEGTVDIRQAVGHAGTVYLTIPGAKAGAGKVTVAFQGRTMEYEALTSGAALPTGAHVLVREVVGPGTVEVEMQGSAGETAATGE